MRRKRQAATPWYVYLVRCGNGALYAGISTNVDKRVKAHNAGVGAKYTRAFGPVYLVYKRKMPSATAARKQEALIKSWPKSRKERLVVS